MRGIFILNSIKAIFVIIGTVIGAGFASGLEIYSFFSKYGENGLIGITISAMLFGLIIYNILKKTNQMDIKSNKGGTRAFAVYDCFKYTLDDFKEKARVLKDGCFLVEVLPAENENNYEYLYHIKQYAKEAGFIYYSKVAWKKGTFVSNTGRKAKNTQDIMIFSKGKARNMRIDTKRTEQTGKLTYMSGCKGMLPTMFDVQPVSKKNRIHQSELPVSLCEQILEFLTYEGEVVLDSFAGSGAVGEAALNLKRNCILIEILKDNIEKIKKRFENNVLMKTAMEW